MTAERVHLSEIPHCEFMRAWDPEEEDQDKVVWDSFCGGRPESVYGPYPCLYPAGVTGWEDCPACNTLRENVKKEKVV